MSYASRVGKGKHWCFTANDIKQYNLLLHVCSSERGVPHDRLYLTEFSDTSHACGICFVDVVSMRRGGFGLAVQRRELDHKGHVLFVR